MLNYVNVIFWFKSVIFNTNFGTLVNEILNIGVNVIKIFKMETLIITTKEDLKDTLREVIVEQDQKRKNNPITKHKAAKRLNISHTTVRKYVERGLIQTTIDGRILESEIDKLLENKITKSSNHDKRK